MKTSPFFRPADAELAEILESKVALLNIELLENAVFALHRAESLDIKRVVELSRAVKVLAAARMAETALSAKFKEEGRKEIEGDMERAALELESGGERLPAMEMFERIRQLYKMEGD